jgi:hypothetical protein
LGRNTAASQKRRNNKLQILNNHPQLGVNRQRAKGLFLKDAVEQRSNVPAENAMTAPTVTCHGLPLKHMGCTLHKIRKKR